MKLKDDDIKGVLSAITLMDWEFHAVTGYDKNEYKNIVNSITDALLERDADEDVIDISLNTKEIYKIERLFFFVSAPQHASVKGTFLDGKVKELYDRWGHYLEIIE